MSAAVTCDRGMRRQQTVHGRVCTELRAGPRGCGVRDRVFKGHLAQGSSLASPTSMSTVAPCSATAPYFLFYELFC